MSGTEAKQNTVYLVGLTPEEERFVCEDFRAYPFPGWQLAVLATGVAPPLDVLEGRAILVVGCGNLRAPDHTETIWRLRLFACANPWVAIVSDSKPTTAEISAAAGAAATLVRPFGASKLRELIWHHALPYAGQMPITALTCERLLRYCALLGSDVLLKFSSDTGRTGFLGLKRGQPFHAQLLDGSEGADAMHEILGWGKGKVLSLPAPSDLRSNLPDRLDAWWKMLRTNSEEPHVAQRTIPGGSEACNRVLSSSPEVTLCVLVDHRTQRIVGYPTGQLPTRENERDLVTTTLDLLQTPLSWNTSERTNERVEEIVLYGQEGWGAAFRVPFGTLAFVVAAPSATPWMLVRSALAEAADDLERHRNLVVESVGT